MKKEMNPINLVASEHDLQKSVGSESNNKPMLDNNDAYYKDITEADMAYTEALQKFVVAKQNGKYGFASVFPIRVPASGFKYPEPERPCVTPCCKIRPLKSTVQNMRQEYSYSRKNSADAFNQAKDFLYVAPNVWIRPGLYIGPTTPEQEVGLSPERKSLTEYENSATSILRKVFPRRAEDFDNIQALIDALDSLTDPFESSSSEKAPNVGKSAASVRTSTPTRKTVPILGDSILVSPIATDPRLAPHRLYADVLQGQCKSVGQRSSTDLERQAIEQYKYTSFDSVIGKLHNPDITPSQDLEQQAVDQYSGSGSETNLRIYYDINFPMPNRTSVPSGKYLQPVNQPSYAQATQQGRTHFH